MNLIIIVIILKLKKIINKDKEIIKNYIIENNHDAKNNESYELLNMLDKVLLNKEGINKFLDSILIFQINNFELIDSNDYNLFIEDE